MATNSSLYDILMKAMALDKLGDMTKLDFKQIRNHGTPEELKEAVLAMVAKGGYENLG